MFLCLHFVVFLLAEKAKPQPPIDIAKLLEKLFSQRRPGTAPPAAATAQHAKISSTSTKPHTTSMRDSTSNVPPSSKPGRSVFPSPSSFKQAVPNKTTFNIAELFPQPKSAVNPKTLFSSESCPQPNLNVVQASVAEGLSRVTVYATSASSTASLGSEEPAAESQTLDKTVETATVLPVESSLSNVEGLETRTSVDEGPVKPSIDVAVHSPAQELQTSTKDSGIVAFVHATRVEPLIETITESPAAVDVLEIRTSVLESPVEPRVGANSRVSMEEPLRETAVESPVESNLPLVEEPQTRSPVVEGSVDLAIEATVDTVAQEAKPADSVLVDAKEQLLKETTIESPVDSAVSQETNKAEVLTLESVTLSEVEAEVRRLESEVLQETCDTLEKEADDLAKVEKIEVKTTAEDVAIFETEAELSTVDSISEATDAIEAETAELMEAMFGSEQGPNRSTEAPLQLGSQHETIVQEVETESTNVLEAMSLESVTLAEVEASLGTLESETLTETTGYLEKEAEIHAGEEKMEVNTTADVVAIFETQSELSTMDSISEVTDAIEAEAAMLMETMFGSERGPKQSTEAPLQEVRPQDKTMGQEADKESLNVLEAMSLKSVTLAEVEASLGTLGSESLSETMGYLEKEAEILAREEKMEVKMTAEDADLLETEAELLTESSISEASEAIEAETFLMEAMFGSEQGPKQSTEASFQEVRPQDEMMGHESGKESLTVLEAMSLESVTLAEVEASLGTLGSESLSETTGYLEKEAEILAEEEKLEIKVRAEDVAILETQTELSTVDSISEATDAIEAETAMLMEAMFGSEQGPKQSTEAPLQEVGPRDETMGHESDKESLNVLEAMSLESVTLAEVEASLGTLGSESLSETMGYLEKEAEILAEEEKMEVMITADDVAILEDEKEAELFRGNSISEASEAIEAETFLMEAMFGSEQGPKQWTEAPLQEVRPQNEMMGHESDKESLNVLEAMSLESVTLAEVEASLGTLGSESLSETTGYLEKEAEILAGEEKMKVNEGTVSKEATEALNLEPLSLPEAETEDLQTDALMEELLFAVPQHTMGETGQRTSPEVVTANILDAVAVDAEAAETDDSPAPPVLTEVQLEQDEEEATGNEENVSMHTDLDPVQRLFLEKIREYKNLHRLNARLLEAEPDYIKHLSEETAKLQRLYGGGDLTSFPQFTFTDPELDQDSK
uniref:ATP synthase peripheral stalk subunit F6, mitochondrial n=1 Tax=Amphiprion percula TaxID=161767 RepID=A0A3P8SSG6_AMPPE